MRTVVFFGGNGHAAERLAPARGALARLLAAGEVAPLDLVDVPYPGFEDRPRARDAEAFLAATAEAIAPAVGRADAVVYGTGIGALLALTLRTRDALGRGPLILQGPVLWGLERRWMPRLARLGLAPLIPRLLGWRAFQRRFARRHFVRAPSEELREAFFAGYARCPAATDLFRWCNPSWLRGLEAAAQRRPDRLAGIEAWWGGRDRVVGPAEVRWTEEALRVRWPERSFPQWGHYPMIDDPEGWVRALAGMPEPRPTVMIGR